MYGLVIHQGELPVTIPVTMTIHGVYAEPTVVRANLPYDRASTGNLSDVLRTKLSQLPVDAKASRMTATIRLRHPEGVIRIADTDAAAVASIERILDKLLEQEKEELVVDSVDLEYRPLAVNELWSPFAIQVTGRGNDGQLLVVARKGADKELGEFTAPIDMTALRQAKLPTQWLDGSNLQTEILKRMSVRTALPLLEQIREREALYLVTMESDATMKIEWPKKDGERAARPPSILVLASTTMGGKRFLMSDGKPMPFTAKP
jgi:hypothetical protein